MATLSPLDLESESTKFFPLISNGYRSFVKKGLLLQKMSDDDKLSRADYLQHARKKEPFDEEEPIFEVDYPNVRPLKRGQTFNFTSVLSSRVVDLVRHISSDFSSSGHDEDVDTNNTTFEYTTVAEALKSKDLVLIVCVFVPAKWSESNAMQLSQLSLISSDLLPNSRFEIVIIPKVRRRPNGNGYYDYIDFINFFSAFPGRLSIPVSDHVACDYFCKRFNFKGELTTVLASRDKVLEVNAWNNIFRFGAAGFPFTLDRLEHLEYELPRLPLTELLGLQPSSKLNKLGSSVSITIEDLSKKVVGLYLFCRGEKFDVYNEVYKQCRDGYGKESQFEVVLICHPTLLSVDPFAHQQVVCSVLNELNIGNSFWFFPYDNSACLRLSRLSRNYYSDAMIIVGPQSQYVEPYGGQILSSFGKEAFPFHRETLIQKFVTMLEAVTLQSLLCRESVDYVVTPDKKQMPISDLLGKNVVLYLENMEHVSLCVFEMVRAWCHEMAKQSNDFAVVYILCRDSNDENMVETPFQDTEWFEYPSDAEHSTLLRMHSSFLFSVNMLEPKPMVGLHPPSVILFGKDGHIHMIDAEYQIGAGGKVNLFNPDVKDLRVQMIRILSDYFEFLEGYEYDE